MKIIWSVTAIKNNEKNVDFLVDEWNEKVKNNYLFELEKTIQLIRVNPKIGMEIKQIKSRKFLVVKQIYLIYKIENSKTIRIMNIWNNKRKPVWL